MLTVIIECEGVLQRASCGAETRSSKAKIIHFVADVNKFTAHSSRMEQIVNLFVCFLMVSIANIYLFYFAVAMIGL